MYHAECMKERYASVTPMLCLGNGYFMPMIHENRPYVCILNFPKTFSGGQLEQELLVPLLKNRVVNSPVSSEGLHSKAV